MKTYLMIVAVVLLETTFTFNATATQADDPKPPLLGWTLAAFHSADWTAHCADQLNKIKSEGFKLVVLTNSYKQTQGDAGYLDIDSSQVPSVQDLANCARLAMDEGIEVIVKPHIDGGWRGGYDFDPECSGYWCKVITRELDAIRIALNSTTCESCKVTFCLGTEFSKSEANYTHSWVSLLDRVKQYTLDQKIEERVKLTYDFMFDFIRTAGTDNIELGNFIDGLDSISISQYTPLDVNGRTASGIVQVFKGYETNVRSYLSKILPSRDGSTTIINFGEFGIGSSGLTKPWVYGGPRADEDVILGFQGLVQFLKERANESPPMEFAAIWTIGDVFDIFGNQYGSRLNGAAELIEAYNYD